jgi:hypothetical protein
LYFLFYGVKKPRKLLTHRFGSPLTGLNADDERKIKTSRTEAQEEDGERKPRIYYHRPKDRTITPLRTLLAALWQRCD